MQAVAVFPASRVVERIDQPEPQIGSPTDVKLRMLEIGICGTDRDIVTFQYGTPPPGQDHLIIGHESLGEVVEIGRAVDQVRPGDLAVLSVRRPCRHGTCFACRAGRPDFCFTGDYTERGIKQLHGYMTEAVVDDQRYVHRVPPELRNVAVLVEPLTIAEKALREVRQVQTRLPWGYPSRPAGGSGYHHKAVVLGAGPVGLLGAMALLHAGFETWVYSRSPDAQRWIELVGALGGVFLPAESVGLTELVGRVDNVDLIFEATGASSLAFAALPYLGTNGVFVFTGVPGRKAAITIDSDRIMRNLVLKNQVVFGTVNADRSAFEAAIADLGAFAQRWPKEVSGLITGKHLIADFRKPLLGHRTGIKDVITFA